MRNILVFNFVILMTIEKSFAQRVRHTIYIATPKDWMPECSFYSKFRLKPILETYLANKDETCTILGLCPQAPDWLSLKDLKWYEKTDKDDENFSLIPSFGDKKPLHLFYKFFIENISSMNLHDSTIRIDFFVELLWFIPKNVCDGYFKILKDNGIVKSNETWIEIEANFFKYFWLPDLFITNSLKSVQKMKPVDTRSLQLNVENKNDEIPFCFLAYQKKEAATVHCRMDFHVYPFDDQICPIKVRSFSFDNQSIIIHWESMDWNRLLNLPGYSVSLRHNRTITGEWMKDYYSVLYVEIVITRQLINLLVGVYFSTFLIIILMISTFWLSAFLITDRLNMGVISVLALYDQYNESKKGLPSIGYMHPLSYWIIFCMFFVFAQLFQNSIYYYIVIHKKSFISRRMKKLNPFKRNQIEDIRTNDSQEFLHSIMSVPLSRHDVDYIPMKFDLVSKFVFLVFFIFFLAIYWPNSIKLSNTYNLLNH